MMKTPMTPPTAVIITSHSPISIPEMIPSHLSMPRIIRPMMVFTARYAIAFNRKYNATTIMMTRIKAPIVVITSGIGE